jgi:hypothetical protein
MKRLLVGLVALTCVAAPSAFAQDAMSLRRAWLLHDSPLHGLVDAGRGKADEPGAFDFQALRIEGRFDGPFLPDTLRYLLTVRSTRPVAGGISLLALNFLPEEATVNGEAADFFHDPGTGELLIFFEGELPEGVELRVDLTAALDLPCGDVPTDCLADQGLLHVAGIGWYPLSYEAPIDDRFQITQSFVAPEPFKVAVTGRREPPTPDEGGTRWTGTTEVPTILVSLAVGAYDVVNAPPLDLYGPAQRTDLVESTARQTLAFFDDAFGPYPFSTLGVAAIADAASAGIGPQALILLPTSLWAVGAQDGDTTELVAQVTRHEIGHQYFFNLIAVLGSNVAWLSEGFAEFAATLASEAAGHPEHATRNYWEYVLNTGGQDEVALTRDVHASPFFFELAYLKGSSVLHLLRRRAGPEAFREVMRRYVATFARQIVTQDEAQAFFSQNVEGGEEVFREFVRKPGFPELVVRAERRDDERAPLRLRLAQRGGRGAPYRIGFPVRVHTWDGETQTIMARTDADRIDVPVPRAQWLEIDPERWIFRRIRPEPAADVNVDGVVDGMDLLDTLAADGRVVFDPDWADRLDVNDDDQVNSTDVQRVRDDVGDGW